jgi:hypothetical protein
MRDGKVAYRAQAVTGAARKTIGHLTGGRRLRVPEADVDQAR